jgi:hypothetical protein
MTWETGQSGNPKGQVVTAGMRLEARRHAVKALQTMVDALDDDDVANWTTVGIDIALHVVDITSTNVNVRSGTYKISSVSAGNLTLAANPMITGSGPIACTYAIRVGVRRLDPDAPNLSLLVPTAGFIPIGTDAVAVYRDRVVWAIGRTWYMSRQGDPGDSASLSIRD